MSKKDVKDVSDLIRKKLELYMNVERRENRFDPKGKFTTTPKMHKYDFLYKVLDSTVLEAPARKSRQYHKYDHRNRPKTSVKSPERSKPTRKSSERVKSSLVRSSVSPRRERRSKRRTSSPASQERQKTDDRSASRSLTRADDKRAGHSFPRADSKLGSQDDSNVSKSEDHSEYDDNPPDRRRAQSAMSGRPQITPRLTDTSRRVVLHNEKGRLTNYANEIFHEIPVDEVQIIHRYRPYHNKSLTNEPKYQGFSRHVGSILKSKDFVDYYNQEGLRHSLEKENQDQQRAKAAIKNDEAHRTDDAGHVPEGPSGAPSSHERGDGLH